MSHIVTIQSEIRDLTALQSACDRMGLAPPMQETVKLFSGEVTGHAVRLPGWRYPVVCDLASGQVEFDNYQGRWGEQRHLDSLMQAYAVEKAKIEACRKGHSATEQRLADGSVKVTIKVGGAV